MVEYLLNVYKTLGQSLVNDTQTHTHLKAVLGLIICHIESQPNHDPEDILFSFSLMVVGFAVVKASPSVSVCAPRHSHTGHIIHRRSLSGSWFWRSAGWDGGSVPGEWLPALRSMAERVSWRESKQESRESQLLPSEDQWQPTHSQDLVMPEFSPLTPATR